MNLEDKAKEYWIKNKKQIIKDCVYLKNNAIDSNSISGEDWIEVIELISNNKISFNSGKIILKEILDQKIKKMELHKKFFISILENNPNLPHIEELKKLIK